MCECLWVFMCINCVRVGVIRLDTNLPTEHVAVYYFIFFFFSFFYKAFSPYGAADFVPAIILCSTAP